MRKLTVAGVLLATLPVGEAQSMYAICLEPRPPSVGFMLRPRKPLCTATRDCTQYEIDSYRAAVRRYYQQLEEYAAEVDSFRKKAGEYIRCMATLD